MGSWGIFWGVLVDSDVRNTRASASNFLLGLPVAPRKARPERSLPLGPHPVSVLVASYLDEDKGGLCLNERWTSSKYIK